MHVNVSGFFVVFHQGLSQTARHAQRGGDCREYADNQLDDDFDGFFFHFLLIVFCLRCRDATCRVTGFSFFPPPLGRFQSEAGKETRHAASLHFFRFFA